MRGDDRRVDARLSQSSILALIAGLIIARRAALGAALGAGGGRGAAVAAAVALSWRPASSRPRALARRPQQRPGQLARWPRAGRGQARVRVRLGLVPGRVRRRHLDVDEPAGRRDLALRARDDGGRAGRDRPAVYAAMVLAGFVALLGTAPAFRRREALVACFVAMVATASPTRGSSPTPRPGRCWASASRSRAPRSRARSPSGRPAPRGATPAQSRVQAA